MQAQARLSRTNDALARSFERLASGMRINRASDDAAGLSIASQLNADSRVYTQALRNVNDGISMLNIADGSISELSNVLTRMKELAESSANGVYSLAQRKSLDQEAHSLHLEYNRILHTTTFNGRMVINPTHTTHIQAGYGTDGMLSFGLGDGLARTVGDATLTNLGQTNVGGASDYVTGDFNGDGNLDFLRTGPGSKTSVMFGDGAGGFGNEQSLFTSTTQQGQVGDFNGDGFDDVILYDYLSGNIDYIESRGNGTFSAAVVRDTVNTGSVRSNIAVGDFDGDGSDDIAVTTGTTKTLEILLNNGDATFSNETTYSDYIGDVNDIRLADFNNDGVLDIVTSTNGGSPRFSIRLGNGDGTFGAVQSTPSVSGAGGGGLDLVVGDFNHDGFQDIVGGDRFYAGNGDGTFAAPSNTTGFKFGAQDLQAADMNGDGILDFVGSDLVEGVLSVYLGVGDGTFTEASSTALQVASSGIALGDFDSDGVFDVLAGNGAEVFLQNTEEVTSLERINLLSQESAQDALTLLTGYIERIGEERGFLGANLSRLHSALNTLSVARENFTSAESRITDADVASESANLVRMQTLQQAGAAVLAQANLAPNIALSLLRQ